MRLRGITYQLVCACFILSTLWLSSTADFTTSPPKSEPKSLEKKFEQWLGHHGKEYKAKDEWLLRFSTYQANLQLIDFINSQNYSFKLTDNKFADMTNDEFRSSYLGRMSMITKGSRESKRNRDAYVDKKPLPERVDWRKKGAVTSVKDQGECGSCWAFSAVAAIEGLHKIKSGKLLDLSEQVLLDCDTKGKNQGCAGGFMDKAFEFIHKHGGLTTEKDYPYKGKQHTCNQTKLSHHSVSISGYKTVPENDAKSLQAAIARQPVSVAIDAGHFAFQLYGGGVYSIFCGKNLNHGVTAVGYGQEGRDKYWLVKNSWGENWGEGGYIRINRGLSDKSGTCGIAMEASYPMKKSKKYEK